MADIFHIPSIFLKIGEETETVTIPFTQGVDELIVLEFVNEGPGLARLVVTNDNDRVQGTILIDGVGTRRETFFRLTSSVSIRVETIVGDSTVSVVEKIDATSVLPPGSTTIGRNNYVVVQSVSDLPSPFAGVITLAAGVTYEINGLVDIGTNRLNASTAACLRGVCNDTDKLVTNNATSLISSTTGLELDNLTLENNGGPVFDIDGGGTGTCVMKAFAVESSMAIGDIDNCAVISLRNWTVITTSDGLTIDGTNSFVLITAVLSQANLGTFTWLTIPATAAFTGITMHDLAIDSVASQTSLDISASATITELGVVTSSAFTGAGTALTGITKADLSWLFKTNTGISDSSTIGQMTMANNTTVTDIITVGVFEDIDGTFSNGTLERFSGSAAGVLTYDGLTPIDVMIVVSTSSVTVGGTITSFSIRVVKNGTIQQGISMGGQHHGSEDTPLALVTTASLVNGDTLQVQIANDVLIEDITVVDISFVVR